MPIIAYSCECGTIMKKFYRMAKSAPSCFSCNKCDKIAKKILSAPSSSSIIVVDNGIQAKSVEVNMEIIESNKERSEKNYREN
jgi:hypothetical protein